LLPPAARFGFVIRAVPTGEAGAILMCATQKLAIRENAGAATVPPNSPVRGESMVTTMSTLGAPAGRNPANEAM